MKINLQLLLTSFLLLTINISQGEVSHDDSHKGDPDSEQDNHSDHEENNHAAVVSLNLQQQQLAGIQANLLQSQIWQFEIYAPAEVKSNAYSSYLVSPRVDSVVQQRLVALGDHVTKGQVLLSLFSESVAQGQANYLLTKAEWRRVKQLGRTSVGEKRYVAAKVNHQTAFARLVAYGLSRAAINSDTVFGQYELTARINGVVLADDFHQGQRVQAGDTLIKISDERSLWIEAQLSPRLQVTLAKGSPARVLVNEQWYEATVQQEAHTINPVTRTRSLRLAVDNQQHKLHSGMFAEVYFPGQSNGTEMAVDQQALVRGSDGDWMVFVELTPGRYQAQEVQLGRSSGQMQVITGVKSGTRVVSQGAFFIASELAKANFDTHNH